MENFNAADYSIMVKRIVEEGVHLFYASPSEIPEISAYSDSYEDAYQQCIEALMILYEEAKKHGKSFPLPYEADPHKAFSGRVTLRMSKSLHAQVAKFAAEDGISQNQWIVEAIAQRTGYYQGAKTSTSTKVLNALFSSALSPYIKPLLTDSPATQRLNQQTRGLLSSNEPKYLPL